MDKGLAPCFPNNKPVVLLEVTSWVSKYIEDACRPSERAYMMISMISHHHTGLRSSVKYIVKLWGYMGMVNQVHLPPPIVESRAIYEHLYRSMECRLMLWRPMDFYTHPTCANVALWRVRTPYGRPNPKWRPSAILHKIQCVP